MLILIVGCSSQPAIKKPLDPDVNDCAYGAENVEELQDCLWYGETIQIIEV